MFARSAVRRAGAIAGLAAYALTAPLAHAADLTIDDRALSTSGKWAKVSQSKANAKTLLRSKKKGATLTTKVKATTGGTVVFQVGKARGTATITVGGKKQATVKTSAKRTAFKSVSFKGSGAVKVTVTKQGGGVYVDAVVLTGLGSSGGGGGTTTPGGGTTTPTPTPASPVFLGSITQLDASAGGAGGNGGDVGSAVISPDGTTVAFWSQATNLVPGVTDGRWHLYLKTLSSGAIRVFDTTQSNVLAVGSTGAGNGLGMAWSPDSSKVAFVSPDPTLAGFTLTGTGDYLYSKSVATGAVAALADTMLHDVAWSPDGTRIAFRAEGNYCPTSTVACTFPGGTDDRIWVLDIAADKVNPVSADASGAMPPYIGGPNDSSRPVWSPDSKKIAFESSSSNLLGDDTNITSDIFVKDITTQALTRVSTTPAGGQANGGSYGPAWSPDGTRIAFYSSATNLVPGDGNSASDVFVKTLGSGAVQAASASPAGEFKLFDHTFPRWSPDGTRIAFTSEAVDLIPGYVDANQRTDIYVRDLTTGTFTLASARADGIIGANASTLFGMWGNSGGWMPDGHGLMFASRSTNFSDADTNAFNQSLFLKRGL